MGLNDSLMRRKRCGLFSFVWFLLFLYHRIPIVFAYSSGPPEEACGTMKPDHGGQSQTSLPPFSVSLSSASVLAHEPVDITLSSSADFKGFFIQVRKVGEDKPAGKFDGNEGTKGKLKTMDCLGMSNSAVSHTNSDAKSTVTARWIAPSEGEYQVFYTGVQEFSTFWTLVQHQEKIRVTKNLNPPKPEPSTTNPAPKPTSEDLLERLGNIYKTCNSSRGCFGLPEDCITNFKRNNKETETCDIMVAWKRNNEGINEFTLTGRTGKVDGSGYIALGISEDDNMGEDSVVGCTFGEKQNKKPQISRYYNLGNDDISFPSNPMLGLAAISSSVIDGNIFCNFTQTNHKINEIDVNFGKKYYYLLSRGASFSNEGLGKHATTAHRGVTSKPVHISDTAVVSPEATKSSLFVHIHGTVMLFGWIVFTSCGMLVSRYYRQTYVDNPVCGKPLWLAFHVFCMITTAILTIIGISSIYWIRGLKLASLHAIFGAVVIVVMIMQMCFGIRDFSCSLSTRKTLRWIHYIFAYLLHFLAYLCILLVSKLDHVSGSLNSGGWIGGLTAVIIFHIVMHIVMTYHTYRVDGEMGAEPEFRNRALRPGPIQNNGQFGEAPGTTFRVWMLASYLIVLSGLAGLMTFFVLGIE